MHKSVALSSRCLISETIDGCWSPWQTLILDRRYEYPIELIINIRYLNNNMQPDPPKSKAFLGLGLS